MLLNISRWEISVLIPTKQAGASHHQNTLKFPALHPVIWSDFAHHHHREHKLRNEFMLRHAGHSWRGVMKRRVTHGMTKQATDGLHVGDKSSGRIWKTSVTGGSYTWTDDTRQEEKPSWQPLNGQNNPCGRVDVWICLSVSPQHKKMYLLIQIKQWQEQTNELHLCKRNRKMSWIILLLVQNL